MQERLLGQRIHADRLVSSTLPRALQTAEYVARALGLPVLRDVLGALTVGRVAAGWVMPDEGASC